MKILSRIYFIILISMLAISISFGQEIRKDRTGGMTFLAKETKKQVDMILKERELSLKKRTDPALFIKIIKQSLSK